MNTENSKTREAHKVNLKNSNKNMALTNLNFYYTWKNIKSAYNNNKFKMSVPTWSAEFEMVLIQFQTFKITLNFS